MRYLKKGGILPSIFVLTAFFLLQAPVFADDPKGPDKHEREQIKADEYRRRSVFNSRIDLEYPNIYQYPADRSVDYRSLSDQIHRLSELLKKLEREEGRTGDTGERFIPTAPPKVLDSVPPGGYKDDLSYIYGPEGPTVRSVRILLEYHLLVMGNTRLKVGDITDEIQYIRARVMTIDNSPVEEYRIDKKTGIWKEIR